MRLRPNYLSAGAACAGGAALAAVGLVAHREALAVVAAPIRFFHAAVGALVGCRGGAAACVHLVAGLVGSLVVHFQGSPFRSMKRSYLLRQGTCSRMLPSLVGISCLLRSV